MNTMSFSQAATVLNAIVSQATGQNNLTAITTPGDFAAVAQTALLTGLDPILNTVSQIWSRTIFSERAWENPLRSLYWSLPRYGNAVRKLSPVAGVMQDDNSYKWPVAYDAGQTPPSGNGQSVDHYTIHKQDVLQTNFYGTAVYEQQYTIFKDQFEACFESADEFARFMAMNLTERNNDKQSYEEGIARGLQANFIAGIIDENATGRIIHLLTEYNAATGLSLTATTVMQPGNFEGFIRWMYARIKTIVRMMGERSNLFQTNITGKTILRHTTPDNMRIALWTPFMEMIESMVLSQTFRDEYMKLPIWEGINYWQAIGTPDSISMTPVYTGTNGAIATASAVAQGDIVGFIHDRDALGYAITNPVSAVTPLNAKGLYWNEFYHARFKTISDNTEKAVVLLLD